MAEWGDSGDSVPHPFSFFWPRRRTCVLTLFDLRLWPCPFPFPFPLHSSNPPFPFPSSFLAHWVMAPVELACCPCCGPFPSASLIWQNDFTILSLLWPSIRLLTYLRWVPFQWREPAGNHCPSPWIITVTWTRHLEHWALIIKVNFCCHRYWCGFFEWCLIMFEDGYYFVDAKTNRITFLYDLVWVAISTCFSALAFVTGYNLNFISEVLPYF